MLSHTRDVTFLEEGDVEGDGGGVTFTDPRRPGGHAKKTKVTWDASAGEKRLSHFMLEGDSRSPQTILDTIRDVTLRERRSRVAGYRPDAETVRRRGAHLDRGVRHQLARGLGRKYLLEEMVRTPVQVDIGSEFRYRDPLIEKNDLFITISQSGKPGHLGGRPGSQTKGARVVSIVNVVAARWLANRMACCTRTVALKSASRRRKPYQSVGGALHAGPCTSAGYGAS